MSVTHSTKHNNTTQAEPTLQSPQSDEKDRQSVGGKKSIFGSFWIDQSEFAIPVSAIREVVNEPKKISSIPLAPRFMKGLFNLRGMIIPIVDLRILLEFPSFGDTEDLMEGRKIAIIENANKCIGILFDRAGEVLNEHASSCVRFKGNEDGIKDVVIDGVLKLENGDRIVQIIDPYEMLRIERVPTSEGSEFKLDQRADLGKRLSCVSFQLGHTSCAIDLRFVQEVRDMPPVDKSLLSYDCVLGTINLRGIIIPVVDFRSFMGNEVAFEMSQKEQSQRKLLVMKTDGGLIGLMVFSIDNIIPFFEGEILPFAKLALPRGNIVEGCLLSEEQQLVMLLDHTQLMSDPVLSEPARICQEVYNKIEEDTNATEKVRQIERKTYIIFSISNRFAMDTVHVSEVIDRPSQLLEPPYALDHVEGIVNLRGDLITLINLRRLYNLEPNLNTEQKIVIFKYRSQKYAILVDSVDEIVMTTSDKISKSNEAGSSGLGKSGSKDVSEVLKLPSENEGEMMVMIMDVDALVARCDVALGTRS